MSPIEPQAATPIYTLSLHDALPILDVILNVACGEDAGDVRARRSRIRSEITGLVVVEPVEEERGGRVVADGDEHRVRVDRKSTRLNSSHVKISYAVFCLKKKRCVFV